MNRVAFEIFGLPIMWYGVLITIGVVAAFGVAYVNHLRSDKEVSFDHMSDAFLYAFPLAILGARIYYVIFEWENYDTLREILAFRSGGLAIHGGLIGAAIGVLIYKKVAKRTAREILSMADAAVPGIILAQAIGRWGNFVNQEAHGGPVTRSFIERFPAFIQEGMFINGAYYHPTFLYESIWNVLMFIVLMVLFGKRKQFAPGFNIYFYMILYSIGRFFIEGLRTDSLMFLGLRQAQLISVAAILFGALMLYFTNRKSKNKA